MSAVSALIAVRLATATGPVPLLARFSYAVDNPFAVEASFFDGIDVLASWQFDRQMLTEGLHRTVGEGDVVFGPEPESGADELRVVLRNGRDGQAGLAVLSVDARAVRMFLHRTYALVAAGQEFLDLDRSLLEFLAG
ncbi:SsgA family sporulation/cell division regulator [Streptomyces sp. NPDC047014]|uniref:SsgA family sporulation/cell division regulator n=1 Tax=Streptomyces sp. NPDC047014 TaxID=3155736 RepID=UPI0033FE5101